MTLLRGKERKKKTKKEKKKSSFQTLEEVPQQIKKDKAVFLAQLCSHVPKTSQKAFLPDAVA